MLLLVFDVDNLNANVIHKESALARMPLCIVFRYYSQGAKRSGYRMRLPQVEAVARNQDKYNAAAARCGLTTISTSRLSATRKRSRRSTEKLPEISAQHLRDIGLADAEQASCFGLFQPALLDDLIDLEHEARLCQVLFHIRHAEILKYIPALDFVLLLGHAYLPG